MLLPAEAPVMILSNAILFPQAMLPLFIFEPRYRKMLADSLATHRTFVVAMQKPGRQRETPSMVAGLGLVRAAVTNKDGTSHLVLQGLARVNLGAAVRYKPYRVHQIQPIATLGSKNERVTFLASQVLDLVSARMQQGFDLPIQLMTKMPGESGEIDGAEGLSLQQVIQYLRSVQDPCQLADLVSCTLLPTPVERQIILETADLEKRLNFLVKFLLTDIKTRSKKKP